MLSEVSQDEKQLTFTAFDPLKGRGQVLRTIQKDPAGLSPADSLPTGLPLRFRGVATPRFAFACFHSQGSLDREFTVKVWPSTFYGVDWSSDGKGLYCGSRSPLGDTILYVDLMGNARVLLEFKAAGGEIWGIPSPDGRYLAIQGSVYNSNVWMLEGF